MWPVLAAAFARATTVDEDAPFATAVPVALAAEGVLAVTAGAEPEPPVLVECPCSAKNHTPANRHTATRAI